jgi:hypothetical protein
MSKHVALLLIAMLAASSLIMLESAFAQSTLKPSVPEFTLSYVVRPYDIGPPYTIDPYTGENITLVPEIHTTRSWVDITVKNQPFSSYVDADGNTISLFYNVSLKGHFGDTWGHYPDSTYQDLFNASASDKTVIEISLGNWPGLGSNSQLDFRLEALIGHYNYNRAPTGTEYVTGFSTYESSGWSNTQTITVYPSSSSPTPTSSPATTPTPTPTPAPTPIQVPGQSSFSIESNSTIMELFFNSTSSELTFTVNGTHGTAGYVRVTIAKSLVSSIQNIKAYLDGEQLAVAITSDGDFWLLSFTYMHSTHHVRISLATNAATTPLLGIANWIWIAAVVIAVVGAGLLVYFRKRKK